MIIFVVDKKTIDHILNCLRKGTVTWHGRNECLKRYRKKKLIRLSKEGKRVYKYYYPCLKCKQWFRDVREVEVDHIVEIGSFNGSFDEHIPRMYCDQDNLQPLCLVCHKAKTKSFTASPVRYQRKK